MCVDLLYDGADFTELPGPAVRHRPHPRRRGQHGRGRSPSGLARGLAVPDAVALGKRYMVQAVRSSYPLGAGHGPVSPLWAIRPWWDRHPDATRTDRCAIARAASATSVDGDEHHGHARGPHRGPGVPLAGRDLHRRPDRRAADRCAAPDAGPVPAGARARSPRSTSRRPARRPAWSPWSPAPTSTWRRRCCSRPRPRAWSGPGWPPRRCGSSASRWRPCSPSRPTRARTRPTWSRSTTTRCRRWSTCGPPPPTRCCCSTTSAPTRPTGFGLDKEFDEHLFDDCEVVVTQEIVNQRLAAVRAGDPGRRGGLGRGRAGHPLVLHAERAGRPATRWPAGSASTPRRCT